MRENGTIDIGAYELQTLNLVVDTLVDESDGDYSALDLSLREALELTNANPGADTITFDAGLALGSINLDIALGQLEISDDVTLTGLGASDLTVDGGGNSRVLHITGGTVDISGLTLTGGSVDRGAAIRNEAAATTTLTDMFFTGNTATTNGGDGGGGLWNAGDLTVTSSTISDNVALSGAGGLFSSGTLTILSSTISGNMATSSGGGIFINGGTLTVQHSTVTGNSANVGGGIYQASGTTTLSHTVVSGNTASNGSEIRRLAGTVNLNDYNLLGDSSQTNAQAFSSVTPSGTDITATSDGTNPTHINSIIHPDLLDLGGPTLTHGLFPVSPALDGGDPTAVAGVETVPLYDQRGIGLDRVVDVGAGALIDIGAYEAQTLPLNGDLNLDGLVDALDFGILVASFGTLGKGYADGNLNGDPYVDAADIGIMFAAWTGDTGPTPVTLAATGNSQAAPKAAKLQSASQPISQPKAAREFTNNIPANFLLRPSDLGLGESSTSSHHRPTEEPTRIEYLDQAFSNSWNSLLAIQVENATDDLVGTSPGNSEEASQSTDEAFAMLVDEMGFFEL